MKIWIFQIFVPLYSCMCRGHFLSISHHFISCFVVLREKGCVFILDPNLDMEQLAEINFIAAMEGQSAEHTLAKIVSTFARLIRTWKSTFECLRELLVITLALECPRTHRKS